MNWSRSTWDDTGDGVESGKVYPLVSRICHTFQEFPVMAPFSSNLKLLIL